MHNLVEFICRYPVLDMRCGEVKNFSTHLWNKVDQRPWTRRFGSERRCVVDLHGKHSAASSGLLKSESGVVDLRALSLLWVYL